ncbi:MAG: 1-acyl-sn-glycerol-3-phosphate acyltransferase [Ruminococcus sp.]|nr:1-acyl-sn-glycerol-3-phosphate acyltransferase [Ruminococcus sp.]
MYHLGRAVVWIAFHLCYSLRFEGRENIPKDRSVILASNHRTNADPPLVACGVKKRKCCFMAKEELFRNKLFGGLIRALGAFPVSRGKGDTKVIDTACERLEEGRHLMIFPEGTRSKDGKVHRGHTGAALISARTGKEIVPVGIVFGEKLKFRCRITVKYGEPINPADYCEIGPEPNPRALVKLKNAYMAEIKKLVEGEQPEESAEEVKADE